jgi:hypothetical protein
MAALFAVSFVLRWLFADGDFIGDDAWYFYLARGFGLEPGVQAEHPYFHIANRPLYYLFFHLSTYAGLWGFRLLACCVAAAVPVLCFQAARALGASLGAAMLMAAGLCAHSQHLEYGARGFPDALASEWALAACWAAARGAGPATLLLSIASVLSKESFLVVPAIATWLRWNTQESTGLPGTNFGPPALVLDRWSVATLLLPVAYVGLVTSISLNVPGVTMQGWSSAPFTLRDARKMWVGPELWPLIAWIVWRRDWRIVVLWLGLPAFYLAWNKLLGRGMAPWYAIGPSALSAVAGALALDLLRSELQQRGRSRWAQRALLTLAMSCFAPVPVFGLLKARAQLVQLGWELPRPSAAPEVQALLRRLRPESVLLVNCFWAYRYTHLRAARGPATATWWYSPADTGKLTELAQRAQITIVCRQPQREPLEQTLSQAGRATLFRNERWLVLGPADATGDRRSEM